MSRSCPSRIRFYLRALSYFKSDWPLIAAWMALIGCGTGIGLLGPWPMAMLADNVLGHAPDADGFHRLFLSIMPSSTVGKIIGLAAFGLALKVGGDSVGVLQGIVCNQINYTGLLLVRCDLFRKLQALSLSYHRSHSQGDAIYRFNTDTLGAQALLGVLVSTLVAAITLVVMTIILSQRSVTLTLLAFSVAPLLAFANVIFGRRFKARTLECKEYDSRFNNNVQQSMSCMSLVQAFGREEQEYTHFHGTIRDNIRAWWRLNREQFAYNVITGACFGLGGAAIFGYGGWLVSQGTLTIGDLLVFTAYLGMLWGPLCQLTGFTANLQGGAAAMERIFEILDRDEPIADRPDAISLPVQPRSIELRNVEFAYEPGAKVLDGLSVRIEPGQTVAFVGASGTGKSTLLNLLPRFYDPCGGRIEIDGIDARDIKLKDLRRHTALVLQEPVMLPTTVDDNIAYGRPGPSEAEIIRAARMAGAASFIDKFEHGYDTPVAEGGSNLSGGQRQRIAIARALLTEAPFIILDEPTSALDPLGERLVTQTLDGLKGQRTIILVSHRLSTVVNADRIFVMDAGRVIEQGTHSELLAMGGLYAQMADDQMGVARPIRVAA